MPLSANQVAVAQALQAVLQTNANTLGLAHVGYGRDPALVPQFPSAFVENGQESRGEWATREWRIDFVVFVNLIYGKVQNTETNQLAAEQLAQSVKAVLHQDKKLGGLVIFGYITRIEPVLLRGAVMLRSMRLTWNAQSRETF